MTMRILITRPAPDAARSAAKLRAAGHEVSVDSLLSIEPMPLVSPQGDYAAVAITSANALRAIDAAVVKKFNSLPIFALGMHTANTARLAGFVDIEVAGGDVQSLAALLARRLPAGARVLYLAGENRARDLATLTASSKLAIDTRVVYRARAAERLQETTAAKLRAGEIDAVLHFSPRSAETFVALARKAGLESSLPPMRHLCLSAAVAAVLAPAGIEGEVAARPEEEALLALLEG